MEQLKFMKKKWMHNNNTRMKKIMILIAAGSFTLLSMQSCKQASGDYPGDGYTYDMMYSRAYETYALNPVMRDSMGAILPVKGTVPFGGDPTTGDFDAAKAEINLPYEYANTLEDYERAGVELINPVAPTEENIAQGKYVFEIYCAVCHGTAGNGQGSIVVSGKYKAVPPSYFDALLLEMPDGKMFHSITYGKNAMGSYAYAVSKEDRWKVIQYINKLQNDYVAANPAVLTVATTN